MSSLVGSKLILWSIIIIKSLPLQAGSIFPALDVCVRLLQPYQIEDNKRSQKKETRSLCENHDGRTNQSSEDTGEKAVRSAQSSNWQQLERQRMIEK
ncbi:hypothetical protein Mapa_011789 [Marchantia paleacea]|nr:hypothetical protein Mapa_011789 [Marchantia paleacea]